MNLICRTKMNKSISFEFFVQQIWANLAGVIGFNVWAGTGLENATDGAESTGVFFDVNELKIIFLYTKKISYLLLLYLFCVEFEFSW